MTINWLCLDCPPDAVMDLVFLVDTSSSIRKVTLSVHVHLYRFVTDRRVGRTMITIELHQFLKTPIN